MHNISVEVCGPERWDVVERFVLALLGELDEGTPPGWLRPHVRNAWEAQPDRMQAVLAYDRGEALGLLTLVEGFAVYANGAYGVIPEMYVVPAARSIGVGRRLIERAVEIGRARGWSRIDVTAPQSAWERSVRFYESCGFTFAGPKLKKTL